MGILDKTGKALGLGGETGSVESAPWEAQQPYLREGFTGAQGLYRQGPQQYYQGQAVASVNPNLVTYFGGMGDHARAGVGQGQDISGYGQQMAGGIPQAQQFYSQAMGDYFNPYASAEYNKIISDSVSNNPVLQSQIQMGQQDINRNMQENILPSIASGSVATGNTGSTRRGVAEGVAMRGAMEQGSDLATGLQANAYNQGVSRAGDWARGQQFGQQYGMNAANQLAGMGQTGLQNIGAGYGLGSQSYQDLMGAGMFERGIEQEGMSEAQRRFDFEQNAPWANLQRYQQSISGDFGGTQTQFQDPGNIMAQLGAQGASAAVASDRRLKTNIRKIGEIDGMNHYEWDWNEKGKEFCGSQNTKGFIFDEVPEHMRLMSLSGYGLVDYSNHMEAIH